MSLITRLHKLKSLAVSDKEFIDKGMVNLSRLNEWWYLSLHGQPITDELLRHIERMGWLEVFGIIKTKIDGSGLHDLSGLRDLKTLKQGGASVRDEELKPLKRVWGSEA